MNTIVKRSDKKNYPNYVLYVLLLVGIFAWVDRQIFAMLMQSIKEEFTFSDTQLGLLGGVAFAIFYASAGLPIAWLGDRFNRRNIISFALALWSAMTALCGLATGFSTLFLARIGVGVGEAGASPPAQSLISDYFPPEKRGAALATYFLFIPLGFFFGFLIGGWIDQLASWRVAFMVVGIPGIVLALVVWLTVKELPRGISESKQFTQNSSSMASTLKFFLGRKSLVHIALGGAIFGIGGFGISLWTPTYFMRLHEMSSGQVGTWMAAVFVIGGTTGTITGGRLADRLYKKSGNIRWYLWISVIAILIGIPFTTLIFLFDSYFLAFVSFLIALFFTNIFSGPVMAMVQALAGIHRRTQAAAFYLFLVNLISMSLGPLIIGWITDLQGGSTAALRYTILSLAAISLLWSSIHFYLASRNLEKDLKSAGFEFSS